MLTLKICCFSLKMSFQMFLDTHVRSNTTSLVTTDRIRAKLYPVPFHFKPYFQDEVDKLHEQDIFSLSSLPHCSPVVMLRKQVGFYRVAIDYRQLNSVTASQTEPACTVEEDLYKSAGVRYFSELGLCKAYYQIPVPEKTKPLTAFPTHRDLMEFNRLSYDLAPTYATYIRLMRIVLAGLFNVSFYFDISIYSTGWSKQVISLRSVLLRLRQQHLRVKPSKCKFRISTI